ncbi:MAG TPA: methyl-accepting chemotaxis protein [Candidatus Methylomirabilis sp.]|nr:methyl-accepting chemotaxis protein [Candidatus Methylomirabilis sp.]
MRWNSLSTRLVATFTVLVLAVMAVVTGFAYMRTKVALEEMLENHGKMLIAAMETTTADRLILYDYVSLRNHVANLVAKERVLSFAAVVNGEGTVIAHSDHAQEGKKVGQTGVAGGAAVTKPGSAVAEREITYNGNRVLELSHNIVVSGKTWGVVMLGINHKGVDAILRKLAGSISLMGILILSAAVVAARMFTTKMTSGLERLVESTRQVAAGELRERIPEDGVEEVRSLARAFNAMAENLRTVLGQIQEAGSSVGTFSSGILTVIQDQAASASQQATSVAEVTATMEELSRTSRQIAQNAESVKEAASKSVEVAQHGTTLGREGVEAMAQIKERVGDIARKTLFLGEKSHEIGKVMEIIKEIAGEIHLLALNAAIESAAAGEHGRRFGVVASEVRRLAEKTRESTETIRGIIAEIQSATNSSVEATEQGTREVEKWKETIRLSSEAFSEIIETIERTSEASTQISLATHQQTSANEQVVQAMRQIEEMVRVTASQMKESSASAARLREMAGALQEKTAVFRV